ncbi:NAD(P)-dependent alcohol dehydrogenase [Paracoccus sp. (in: a-proteobacteria)]|uniref:NAD(P)-dependent alcohol dehydrogenase n=1 Tax=Paracoccus sp. TaxID=267 RepID=UPI003A85234D
MRAAICTAYGPPEVVRLVALPDPVPQQGEVLIRVRASTVASADHRIRAMDFPVGFHLLGRLIFGIRAPRQQILGTELSGVILVTGEGVDGWQEGQEVVAMPGARMGAHAELIVMKADGAMSPKPERLDFGQAAALSFGGTTALYFLRDRADLQSGESVLVTGAGGAVGSAVIQIARAMGGQVTAIAGADKTEILQGLGFTDLIPPNAPPDGSRQWDVIVDCAGIVGLGHARDWLAAKGRLCKVHASLPQMLGAMVLRLGQGRRILCGAAPERSVDLQTLALMADEGDFLPLIGARMPMSQIVEAHRLAAGGHKLGNTVIEMGR